MSPSQSSQVRRGEVWLARLDPTQGAEMGKTRPVVIISADGMGVLPVKLVAPCTTTELARCALARASGQERSQRPRSRHNHRLDADSSH